MLLAVLPWSTFWERNYFGYAWPVIRPIMGNHFVRGAVTGLGLLNLLVGFAELFPVFTARGRLLAEPGGPDRVDPYPNRDTRAEP